MKIGQLNRAPYPVGMIVDIHSYCNARCKMCPYQELSSRIPMGHMSWSLYTKIIDDYSRLMQQYNFVGKFTYCYMSEPFIKKDIAVWVKYAIERGLEVYFNTNASLLTADVVDALKDIGFQGVFIVSCHGITKDVYEHATGLDLSNVLKNIDYVLDMYPSKNVAINAVPYNWPKGERERIFNYWGKKGVSVGVTEPISRASLVRYLKKPSRKRIVGCLPEKILYQMVISFNGEVVLCCNDMSREIIVGNLNDSTIYEVWNGKIFQNILETIYSGKKLPSTFLCNRCEESLEYWSWRRIVKSIIPNILLKQIQKRRNRIWILKQ